MKKMSASSKGKPRFSKIYMVIVGLCLLFMILEAPNLFFRPTKLVVRRPDQQLKIVDVNDGIEPQKEEEEEDYAGGAAKTPVVSTAPSGDAGGAADLQHVADLAAAAGAKMWARVVSSNSTRRRKSEEAKCRQMVMFTGKELSANNATMELPCGLTMGSSITIVARPQKAHVEDSRGPHISRGRNDRGKAKEVQVSQFFLELRGVKMAAGEDPPRILHFNPRLRGDWSNRPVIELNTQYRQQWGTAQRCDGWRSRPSEPTVDGLPKCEHWLREEVGAGNSTLRPDEKLKSMVKSTDKSGGDNWLFPFIEEQLFVLTIRAGWEGYHVIVDGRHVASFPYRINFLLEEATGLAVAGDIDIRSVVATSLPSTASSSDEFSGRSEKYKAPKLPTGPAQLFIGILSKGSHFKERMAVRKTWMQSEAVLSSQVVVRFFVGLESDLDVNIQVKEEADFYNDMVILPVMDDYNLVVLKTIAICEFAVKNITVSHVMKADDDTFVRVEAVSNLLKRKFKSPGLYIGSINQYHKPQRTPGKWKVSKEEWPEDEYPPYANGAGYIISAEIAKFIVSHKENNTLQIFKMEDVNMGIWVTQYNAIAEVEYIQLPKFVHWGCSEEYYSAHYQSPRQMVCMWDKLKQGEARCCNSR